MPYIFVFLVIGILSFIQPAFAQSWTDPVGTPPSDNAPAPLNISAASQAKAGGVSAASFLSTGSMAAQGNIGIGMSSAPDAFGVLSSGAYGDAYGKWSSIGRTFSNLPLYLTANDYGFGTVWDSGGVFLGLNNRGSGQKDAVLGWGSNNTYPTDLIYKYNGAEVARMTSGGRLGLGTTTPTQKLSVVGNITGTQLCIGTDCRSSWPAGGGSGTVTSVTAGTGLTGGAITTSGTIAADTAYLQRRVSGTCSSGNAIQTIAADGTVTCQSTASAVEADTLATVTARGNTTATAVALNGGATVASLINNGGSYFVGNVGVGVASPVSPLQVYRSSGGNPSLSSDTTNVATFGTAVTPQLALGGYGTSPYGMWMQAKRNNNDGNSYPLVLNPLGGNVGIGTASPTQKLDVQVNSNYHFGSFYRADGGVGAAAIGAFNDGFSAWQPLNINAGGNTFLAASAGNVGIGTTAPNQKLSINGGIGFANANDADKKLYSPADGDLEWMTNSAATVHGFAVSNQGTKQVYLNTSGNSYLNGGNVGIGTAAPSEKLDVVGGMRVGSGNFTQNVAHGNYHVVQLPAANNGAATGDVGLYTWVSEPGATWTGAGIARNMRNSTGAFPRINTGLSGQMIRFDEGNSINFTTENSSGVRYTPVSVTGNTLCLNGDCRTAWPASGSSGTVTSITAGTGLTGGAITTSGTIAADTAYLQRRVSGNCSVGSAIQSIAADGTVTCQSTSASTPTIDAVLGAGSVTTYRVPNFQAGIDLGNGDSSGGASDTAGIKSWNTLNLYSS